MMSEKWLRCPRDGHVWPTQSKMVKVTCPCCGYKIDAEANRIPDEFKDLQHFNVGEDGVKIWDKTLSTEHSSRIIIDVYFKRGKVWCDYDESDDCKHVQFALSLPVVQDIFKKKGWKTT